MKKKILMYFIILVFTGISITGFFVTQHARSLYKNNVKEHIHTIALLFDHELSRMAGSGEDIDYNSLAKEYSAILSENPRITVIDFQGNVLGESQTDYSSMENHMDRLEVIRAAKGEIGEDIRFSSTLKINFLYLAIPSSLPDLIIRVSVPLYMLNRIDMQILLYSLVGMAAGLLLTGLLAFRFASYISRPVKDLTNAVKEIAGGNYSKRVVIQKHDELGELADTFNDMAFKLDRTVADLTDKNVKFDAILNSMTYCLVAVDLDMKVILMNSITEKLFGVSQENALGRKLIEVIRNHQINEIMQRAVQSNTSSITELALSTPETGTYSIYANPIKSPGADGSNSGGIISMHDITTLKKLEQIRTEFVSNVTHELKTPLTSIRGFVETLRYGAISDPDTASKFLEIIDIEAERLTMLINDILQLSEIESSRSDTNIRQHSLNDIIDEVVSVLQGSAGKKGIQLEIIAAPGIKILANRDRIKQMLINLIDNAIKYNKDNGKVAVTAARNEGRLIIAVEDTGIGIAPQNHARIFERFYRVDKGRSRSMGGTGLGLSIVKHIVNMYNGDISVESEPDKGTRFTVQLPV